MSKEKCLEPEAKAKRIANALIFAGVLLVIFLLAVIIVQFVRIGRANAEKQRYQEAIDELKERIEQDQRDLEYFEKELGMYHQAVEQGWQTP